MESAASQGAAGENRKDGNISEQDSIDESSDDGSKKAKIKS